MEEDLPWECPYSVAEASRLFFLTTFYLLDKVENSLFGHGECKLLVLLMKILFR